jgi:hypothetical protein
MNQVRLGLRAFNRIMSHHLRWLVPLMAFLAAVSGSFLTYSLPSEFMKQHPNQYLLYSYILSILPFIFPAFAIASCVLAIYQGLMQKSLSIVEQEASNLRGQIDLLADNVRSLFEGFLYRFSTKLQFASRDENTERVTLYIFNETNKNFVPCGRYAANPMFKANGRPSYPSTGHLEVPAAVQPRRAGSPPQAVAQPADATG